MKNRANNQIKGIVFILVSAFFYGTYGIWSRLMAVSFGEFTQVWTRGLLLLIVILILNLKFKIFKKIERTNLPWFIIIALSGGLNQAPYFFGFKHLTIGTATMLFYAALVIGGYLIGKLAFNEKITITKYISLFLAIAGMLVIYRLILTSDQILPASLTIIAGLMGACAAVLPKKLSNQYSELHIMSGYFIVMVVANSILGFIFHEKLPAFNQSTVWLAQIGYSAALLFANLAVIEGFKHIEASIGSLIGLAEILFGISFGIIFFAESLTIGTIIGGGLIILSAALPNLLFTKSHKN